MITLLMWHLTRSSLFAGLLLLIVAFLQDRSAAKRYSLLLAAVAGFVLPVHFLVSIGHVLRNLLPASKVILSSPVLIPFTGTIVGPKTILTVPIAAYLVVALWLIGALFFITLWLKQLFAAMPVTASTSANDIEALRRMQTLLGIRHEVRLVTTSCQVEPRLIGILRSTIILPDGLSTRLSAEEFDAILLHELAHAKRRDNLSRSIVRVIGCIFWFYPLLRILERKLNTECELACDEIVLATGSAPKDYLNGILKVCQFHLQQPVPGFSNVSGSNLKQRMEYIMSSKAFSVNSIPSKLGLVFLSGLVAVAISAGFITTNPSFAQSTSTAASNPAGSCLIASRAFPAGTVVRQGARSSLLLCTVTNQRSLWVKTSEESRDRSKDIVNIADPVEETSCAVTAPEGKFCTCERSASHPVPLSDLKRACLYVLHPADIGRPIKERRQHLGHRLQSLPGELFYSQRISRTFGFHRCQVSEKPIFPVVACYDARMKLLKYMGWRCARILLPVGKYHPPVSTHHRHDARIG